jgi:hypothetical protein
MALFLNIGITTASFHASTMYSVFQRALITSNKRECNMGDVHFTNLIFISCVPCALLLSIYISIEAKSSTLISSTSASLLATWISSSSSLVHKCTDWSYYSLIEIWLMVTLSVSALLNLLISYMPCLVYLGGHSISDIYLSQRFILIFNTFLFTIVNLVS